MESRKILALVLISAVLLNAVHASASASVITTFDKILYDIDTGYDFEKYPDKFNAKEITSETLGTVHQLTWKNPDGLMEDMQVEIYAAVEFEVYAPKDFHSKFYTTWAEMEASASRDWLIVDSPYAKVYEGSASETSCDVDFNALLKTIEDYCTDSNSSSSVEGGDTFDNVFMDSVANVNLLRVLGDWAISRLGGGTLSSEICVYSYVVNNMETKEFKFSKMKYYIRYREPVTGGEPLQDDGMYHYFWDGIVTGDMKNVSSPGGMVTEYFCSHFGHDVKISATYTDDASPDGRYFYRHWKQEIVSPVPVCIVPSSTVQSGPMGDTDWYLGKAGFGVPRMSCWLYTTWTSGAADRVGGGTYLMGCLPVDMDRDSDGYKKFIWNGGYRTGSYDWQESLAIINSTALYSTNIPVFSPVFSTAWQEYLKTGKLDAAENGNSYVLPVSSYLYGQLLQNTVAFADGGASLDGSGSITSVLDGDNDTDNGWLKKIYYLLRKTLIDEEGESWLAKIHERLEWTNTWLKALIAENTIADLAGSAVSFISNSLDSVVNSVMDTVQLTVITTAGEAITDAASTKFPFSIYTDYCTVANTFAADPVAPVKKVSFRFGSRGDGSYVIDTEMTINFSRFDGIAKMSRGFWYCIFVVGLIPATRKYVNMINGGKSL